MIPRSFLAPCVWCCALPAAAVLIRPDRDDSEYLELASRYTSSVPLNAPDGEGVLIAPRWVLTAAHRAQAMRDLKPAPKLLIAGRLHEIQSFHLHPDWKKGAANDIALLLLRTDASEVEPTPPYRSRDEEGKAVVIVGHGATGRIGEAAAATNAADRRKRAAINTVDRVTPRSLELAIRDADVASDLQGAVTAGDSGGPAFIETPAGLFVAGIAAATAAPGADGIAVKAGDRQAYARVSAFAPWIDAVMLDVAMQEAESLLDDGSRK